MMDAINDSTLIGSYEKFLPWENDQSLLNQTNSPDDRTGAVYLHDPRLQLATEIAIVTQRPLLLRGEPGSGKSSFAPFIARNINWRYYEFNVTGRMVAKDLLWHFDALRRLRDAQTGQKEIEVYPHKYVKPGVLWWAFNREQARNYYKQKGNENLLSTYIEPFSEINVERNEDRAVILIDEIDKAELNIPNDLLEVMSLNSFTVDETGDLVQRKIPTSKDENEPADKFGNLLIIMTTNDERDLPPAFIRRCIVHTLEEFSDKQKQINRWKEIARLHMEQEIAQQDPEEKLLERLAVKCWELRLENKNIMRKSPCTAEFLDALRVCYRLGVDPDSKFWKQIEQNVLVKKLEQEF